MASALLFGLLSTIVLVLVGGAGKGAGGWGGRGGGGGVILGAGGVPMRLWGRGVLGEQGLGRLGPEGGQCGSWNPGFHEQFCLCMCVGLCQWGCVHVLGCSY